MSEFKIGIGDKVLFKVDRSRHGLLPWDYFTCLTTDVVRQVAKEN